MATVYRGKILTLKSNVHLLGSRDTITKLVKLSDAHIKGDSTEAIDESFKTFLCDLKEVAGIMQKESKVLAGYAKSGKAASTMPSSPDSSLRNSHPHIVKPPAVHHSNPLPRALIRKAIQLRHRAGNPYIGVAAQRRGEV